LEGGVGSGVGEIFSAAESATESDASEGLGGGTEELEGGTIIGLKPDYPDTLATLHGH